MVSITLKCVGRGRLYHADLQQPRAVVDEVKRNNNHVGQQNSRPISHTKEGVLSLITDSQWFQHYSHLDVLLMERRQQFWKMVMRLLLSRCNRVVHE